MFIEPNITDRQKLQRSETGTEELLGNISLLWSEETPESLFTINISSLRDWTICAGNN